MYTTNLIKQTVTIAGTNVLEDVHRRSTWMNEQYIYKAHNLRYSYALYKIKI